MIINFQSRFAALVEAYLAGDDSAKHQTIRRLRKDGRSPSIGETLFLYTGLRGKNARKLGEAVCSEVFKIKICHWHGFRTRNNEQTTREQRMEIAKLDGFSSVEELIQWFNDTHGLPFYGHVIRWNRRKEAE